MEIVLIVSRTRMAKGVCVSGIIENTCEFIRIHDHKGACLKGDAPYQVGERWEMDVKKAWNTRQRPHIEDKQVTPHRRIGQISMKNLTTFVTNNCHITKGSIMELFNHKLTFENSHYPTAYITDKDTPDHSVEFWIADKDLIKTVYTFDTGHKIYYRYGDYKIKYVGFQEPLEIIPQGTMIRMSLANWWSKDPNLEHRCYLQLSGWYYTEKE